MASTATPGSDPSESADNRAGRAASDARATGMTIGLVLLSRVLGVMRDRVLATQFGQNQDTTIFARAFAVPDLIALVIAGGALSSVFIPIFAEYWNDKREDEAWRMFGSIMSIVGVVVALLVIVMEIGAQPLTALLNPKFSPEAVRDTTILTRILLPAQWCFLVGGLMMGSLYARQRFLVPALGPIVYNTAIILGGLLLGRRMGLSSMAWGALIGAFLGNIILPLWEMKRIGVRFIPGFDFRHPGVVRVGRLMIPVLLGQSLSQLNMWITGFFLPDDARFSALRNAYNLTQAPIGIFAQAFGIVLLPTISRLAAEKDWPEFRSAISLGIRRVLFLTVPASVLMAVLAGPLIRLLYKGGKFTEADVALAATALIYYSLSTFAWSGLAILARGFYALQDTKTPIFVTTPMVFAFTGIAYLYSRARPEGFTGLALATSAVGTVTMLLFLFLLQKRAGGLNLRAIALSALRITLAAALSGGIAYALGNLLTPRLGTTPGASLLILLIAGGAALVVYAVACYLLRVPELRGIREMFRRTRKKTT